MLQDRHADSYMIQEGSSLGFIMGTPMYIDNTDDSNVYIGYCKINENLEKDPIVLICKVKIEGTIVTKVWAYGEWADRETLQYK